MCSVTTLIRCPFTRRNLTHTNIIKQSKIMKKLLFVAFMAIFSIQMASAIDVYVSLGKSATKYHKVKDCAGLRNTTATIKKVSEAEAKEMGRDKCARCWAEVTKSTAKKATTTVKKETKKATDAAKKETKKATTTAKKETKKTTDAAKKETKKLNK